MVLRFLGLIFICLPFILNSQNDLKLIRTDSYETNYYTSENEALQNRLYIGNDMFRFLSEEKLDTVLNVFYNFLEKDALIEKRTYDKINDFTISVPIKTNNKEALTKIASNWKKDYSIFFTDLIYNLCNYLLTDSSFSYRSSVEPIYHQFFRNEYRNRYSEFSKTAQTNFAIILEDNVDLKIKDQRSFFKRKYIFDKLTYSEVAVVENNKIDILMSIPLVSKMSKPNNYLALNLIDKTLNDNLDIAYGVNESILLVKNLENNNLGNMLLNLNEKEFKQNSQNIINHLTENISINNLFFYTKDDIEIINAIRDTFSYTSYQEFVTRLNESNKILVINKDSVALEEILLINTGLGIFNKNFPMKSNSIEFQNLEEKKLIYQLYLMMTLNIDLKININGYALEKEYNKVSRKEIKQLINKDKDLKTNFKLSKNTSLALLRSVSIFQALAELGIEEHRMRCNGIISSNESASVKISIQN